MAEKIRGMMRRGDLILLKGSRRVGLEKVAILLKAR
jgi:UDP-N-acetylmuramyl pentapeptide synthase